jgi:putative sporulation protein YtxC
MELLSVILSDHPEEAAPDLAKRLQDQFSNLHKICPHLRMTVHAHETFSEIAVKGVLPHFDLQAMGIEVYASAAQAIADYILDRKEETLLRKMVLADYEFDDPDDLEQVMEYCRQFLFYDRETKKTVRETRWYRKDKIVEEIRSYLEENPRIQLDGFLTFRLHAYYEELREAAEYALDELEMDKQYQEFISLLKYFVYIQEAKIPSAHLIHKGGNDFVILNNELMPINMQEIDATFTLEVLNKDINFEDIIVSTLITVAPEQIYIHTGEPEQPMIRTILQIFEQRARLCPRCRLCEGMPGKTHKQDRMP